MVSGVSLLFTDSAVADADANIERVAADIQTRMAAAAAAGSFQ